MSFQIELHPEAVFEIKESYQWYEHRLQGLGDRFIESIDRRLNEIAEHPERFPKKKKELPGSND